MSLEPEHNQVQLVIFGDFGQQQNLILRTTMYWNVLGKGIARQELDQTEEIIKISHPIAHP